MDVYTKRQRIAKIAKQKRAEPLTLLHHYIDEAWLRVAFHELHKESAPGVDAQTVREYEPDLENKLKSLLDRAKSGTYKAPPVRRVEIPKPGSKETRPIGIPTTEDKILQKAVQMVLEPVYEQEFYEFSFGFRTGKSQHQGLEYLWKKIMDNNIQWVIDLDIRKFFDTVKHEVLRQLLSIRVRDGVITRLIGKWLRAGVLKDGSIEYLDEGTPQGGVISPLLSNIYLHEAIDKWYAEQVRIELKGRSFMIRYADDAILGFENKEEAEKVLMALKKRLEEYGLTLHPEKTRLLYFGKPKNGDLNRNKKEDEDEERLKPGSFDFLGFTHYWGKSFKGNWVVKRKTAGKKFREKLLKMNEWCRANRHLSMKVQYESLCRKLKGHYAYYGITGNIMSLQRYHREVTLIWRKWLRRRSWKGANLNWDRFGELIEKHYPLSPVKVVQSVYAQRNQNMKNRMR